MKIVYTNVIFTLAFFLFILGTLINLKVFGTVFFNATNIERHNKLNLDIFLPILFIIKGILLRLGLLNQKKMSKQNKLLSIIYQYCL